MDAELVFITICFFKQKTAYEMRISDWSSDVCSSDLAMPDAMIDDPEIERRMLFAYEETGPDRFRAAPIPSGLLRLYGGQLLARALRAMQQTATPDRQGHSSHSLFGSTGAADKGVDLSLHGHNNRHSLFHQRPSA